MGKMNRKYQIGNSGLNILDILKYLSNGLTPDQIVIKHPELCLNDITAMIRLAHKIVTRHILLESFRQQSDYESSVAHDKPSLISNNYNNLSDWTEHELIELENLLNNHAYIKELAKIFNRSTLAVKIQMNKMGLKTKEENR